MKSMRKKDPYHSVMTFSLVSFRTNYLSCQSAAGILYKNQLKRTEFAVDQVLRVSIWCKVTEDDDGNVSLGNLAAYLYQNSQYSEEILKFDGLGYLLLDLLGYFNDLVVTRNFPRGPLAIGAIIMESRNNMNMYVWDNLVCSNSIILPYIESISLYS
jgi:hypothetical protein